MSKKSENSLEEHIEKIVLALIGLVCIWLLITRVLISPTDVKYDNKKFSPGDIDIHISRQAEILEEKLNHKPEPKQPYNPQLGDFIAWVDSAVSNINTGISLPLPNNPKDVSIHQPVYALLQVGEVNQVSVEHIRAVAYVPTEEIDEENVYDRAEHEPNDIDFVTVEARFNVAELAGNFYGSFAGEDVREEWRDPCLAKPIFAAVQLQRKELLADGSWSNWQIVPRTKIDARRKMFEVIEDVEDLPRGGIKVRLLQFDDMEVRKELLQPEAYRIASAKEEWFPPSLHRKYTKLQSQIEAQKRREARITEKKGLEREREQVRSVLPGRSGRLSATTPSPGEYSPGRPTGGGVSPGRSIPGARYGYPLSSKDREYPGEKRVRQKYESKKERLSTSKKLSKTAKTTAISDIYDELDKILITEKTDFTKMREPLLFWAHDDTIEPQMCYRYRIRLGLFNPIAGTNQFSEQDKWLKDKAILWSEFSDVTETVEIPGRLYFFPTAIQETTRAVTVTVCRYVLGYWYSRNFTVKQGEVIGKIVESEDTEEENVTIPETIDYSTGAVLVDVIPVNDWSGGRNLRARYYFDMLYSFDEASIEHMPIKTRYWARELQSKFSEIKKLEKEPKEPLRPWRGGRGERRRWPQPQQPGDTSDYPPYAYPPDYPPNY